MYKKINFKDIAKEANVSPSTVSQAFNNPSRVNSDTRKLILETAEMLGFVKRRNKKLCLNTIGIIADNYPNFFLGEFYNVVAMGILEELKSRGLNALVEAFGSKEEIPPQMIAKNRVDGVLFLGKISRDHILMTQQKGIPLVQVGHPIPDMELHTIISDGRAGSILAVGHLIQLGHRNIAIISGEPPFDPVASERLDGYKFALSKAGIKIREEYMVQADFGIPKTAYKQTSKLLDQVDPPTAIFCTSDSLAYRAYKAIKDRGLKIPEDVSVVGFDDISFPGYAEPAFPPLTTVHVDRELMGKTSVEILTDVIDNPHKNVCRYTLPVKLIIKKSTRKLD